MRKVSFNIVAVAILMSAFTLLTPQVTSAAGLVTCQEAGSCNFCQLIVMINDIVSWIIIIATLFSILILAYAGFLLIFSRGDRSALEKGKKIFFQSIIGILIMLAGWTIVDTTLKLFTGNEFGVWNEVRCGAGEFQSGIPKELEERLRDNPMRVVPPVTDGTEGVTGGGVLVGGGETGEVGEMPPLEITIGGSSAADETVTDGSGRYVIDPAVQYVINDPAIPEYDLPAAPNHGHQIEILGESPRSMLRIRDLVTGRDGEIGCRLVAPPVGGC